MGLLLAGTSDQVQVVTGQAVTVDVHASWSDYAAGAITPGRTNSAISTATTTAVVGSPGSSTQRLCKLLTIRNRHATSSVDVTVKHTDGTNALELITVTLAAGEKLQYHERLGWLCIDANGCPKQCFDGSLTGLTAPWTTVILASDVVNNNGVANTLADVTGLTASFDAGDTYWFRFVIAYDAAATTTGSRWAINGGAAPTLLAMTSRYTLTATTETKNYVAAYETPAAANASSLLTGNVCVMEGIILTANANTMVARFASEVASSAITAKAGSRLDYYKTINV